MGLEFETMTNFLIGCGKNKATMLFLSKPRGLAIAVLYPGISNCRDSRRILVDY